MTINNEAIKGLKTAWIKYENDNTDPHEIFFKSHSVRNQQPEYPRGQTLFLLNIPPYATPSTLKNAFARICGSIDSLTIVNSLGFKSVYIVFHEDSSLDKALSLPDNYIIVLNVDKEKSPTGILKWCTEYNTRIKSEKSIKYEVEKFMAEYDDKIAEKKALEKAEGEEEGADGWVTVSGRKKRGQYAPSRKESTIDKIQRKEKEKNTKKELKNFYTFQIREAKRQNLAELRTKFELDKQRLEELKSKRTFRPF